MANTISIEVNDTSIRVCEPKSFSKGKTMGASVKKAFIANLPAGAVTGGVIKQPEAVAQVLRKELSKNGITVKNAVFSVYSDKIAVKEANFPPVNEKKVAQLVLANAGDYFPVDLKDYQLSHFVVGTPPKDAADAKVRVMIVAAPLILIDGYKAVADAAGLKLESVDFAANSRYQVYDSLSLEGISLYVDVDFEYTYLTFMQGDTLLLQRTLPFGGGALVSEYCAETGEDVRHAIAALTDETGASGAETVLGADSLDDMNNRIYTGISRALNVYEGQHADKPLERVILCGVCSKFLRLRDSVAQTGLTTHIIDEIPAVRDYFPQEGALDYIFMAAAAAPLAPIDLKPSNHEREEKLRKRAEKAKTRDNSITTGVVVASVFVAIGIIITVVSYVNLRNAEKYRDSLQAEIDSLQYAQDKYDLYVVYRDSSMHLVNADTSFIEGNNDNIVEFFSKMEENMPSEILLMSIGATNQSVTMNITVPTKEDAARVVNEFRKFELFENIVFTALNETNKNEYGNDFQFALLCEYTQVEAQEVNVTSETNIAQDIEDISNFSFRQRRYSFEPTPTDDAGAQGENIEEDVQ